MGSPLGFHVPLPLALSPWGPSRGPDPALPPIPLGLPEGQAKPLLSQGHTRPAQAQRLRRPLNAAHRGRVAGACLAFRFRAVCAPARPEASPPWRQVQQWVIALHPHEREQLQPGRQPRITVRQPSEVWLTMTRQLAGSARAWRRARLWRPRPLVWLGPLLGVSRTVRNVLVEVLVDPQSQEGRLRGQGRRVCSHWNAGRQIG